MGAQKREDKEIVQVWELVRLGSVFCKLIISSFWLHSSLDSMYAFQAETSSFVIVGYS